MHCLYVFYLRLSSTLAPQTHCLLQASLLTSLISCRELRWASCLPILPGHHGGWSHAWYRLLSSVLLSQKRATPPHWPLHQRCQLSGRLWGPAGCWPNPNPTLGCCRHAHPHMAQHIFLRRTTHHLDWVGCDADHAFHAPRLQIPLRP